MPTAVHTDAEVAIANFARTPGLTLAQSTAVLTANYGLTTEPVEYARRLVKTYLEGNAMHTARALATPKPAALPARAAATVRPTPPKAPPKAPLKPATLAEVVELGVRIAKLEASRATVGKPQVSQEAMAEKSRLDAAFGLGEHAPDAARVCRYDNTTNVLQFGVRAGEGS